jgi:tRNA threonylcarbamoyladenosine biosynthesis protein TsaE
MTASTLTRELPDEAATQAFAAALAPLARPGDVIALFGDLGTGKTAFARAFVRALCGADEEVPSPTFTLVQLYDAADVTIWHFDLYRLERPEDALELDIEEAFAEGVSLIEWPDRLAGLLPRERLDVTLSRGATASGRRITVTGSDGWAVRLEELSHHVCPPDV